MQRLLIALMITGLAFPVHAAAPFAALLGDTHVLFFIALNAVLTVFFVVRFDRFAASHGPEILTTVGIFGCFIGISLALLDFDATNVSASVPQLLNGVKTAFWASVGGVGGALILRLRHRLKRTPIPLAPGAPKGATLDDVVTSMRTLQASLSGSAEGSLLGQLKLMRQDQSDQLQAMRESFDRFAEKTAKDGSQALIDALREVIADFNAKISEQFGDNFKELNAAVAKLLVWQEQYRVELDQSQATHRQVAMALETAARNLESMVDRSGGFVTAAQSLETLTVNLNREYELIVSGQTALADVLSRMRDVTPEFSSKIDDMLAALSDGTVTLQKQVAYIGKELADHLKVSQNEARSLIDSIKQATTRGGAEMETAARNLGAQLQSTQAELKTLLVDTVKASGSDVSANLRQSADQMGKAVQILDKSIQDELNRTMELFARQLASISSQFVKDYTPLTERLREVVRIAERVG